MCSLDLVHFLLALPVCVFPWRCVSMLICLCEPWRRWSGRVMMKLRQQVQPRPPAWAGSRTWERGVPHALIATCPAALQRKRCERQAALQQAIYAVTCGVQHAAHGVGRDCCMQRAASDLRCVCVCVCVCVRVCILGLHSGMHTAAVAHPWQHCSIAVKLTATAANSRRSTGSTRASTT